MENLNTGDILLFDYTGGGLFGLFTYLIKKFTKSNFSHVGMVLKDPVFLNKSLSGLYLWESSKEPYPDPQDNKKKIGVQITPLYEVLNEYKNKGSVYVRHVRSQPKENIKYFFSDKHLKDVHDVVYNKPYDIVPRDWWQAYEQIDSDPQKIDRFWCSALVGYIYTKCGLLNEKTDWSIMRPCDFSLEKEDLDFVNGAFLDESEIKI